ncbi:MMPL family transporter [Streptomyces sp. NPDC058872]|uniref:MMPL family transporter n=1 Tax=Streptomyces sp. NPDC058872 TaxID=3346661 RepID=UPI0036A699F7
MRWAKRPGVPATLLLWLVLAVLSGPFAARLGDAAGAEGQQAPALPGTQSARVAEALNPAGGPEPLPLAVLWTRADGGRITPLQERSARQVVDRLAGPAAAPFPSRDGEAVAAVVEAGPDRLAEQLTSVREAAAGVPGTVVHLAGPAAAQVDLEDSFARTDGMLLAVALGGVVVILLWVYRSALVPLLVIAGALLSLSTASALLYGLARSGLLAVDGQAQGIVFVLVIGASTDYGLLLVARCREEAHRGEESRTAIAVARRATAPPVIASAATVACAMMTLVLATLPADRSLGPAVALAMACSAVTSLTFLPAALVLCGRRVLHTRAPGGGAGPWKGPARAIRCRPRRTWLVCLSLLAAGAACAPLLQQDGVPLHRALPAGSASVTGQAVLARHFPAGTASPLAIVAPRAESTRAAGTASATPGIAAVVVGRESERTTLILATLTDPPDSDRARRTVERLRASLTGTGALVGGQAAQLADIHTAAARDHRLIMPLVLLVVLVVLVILLRCLLLPVLLVVAAGAGLLAALGAAALALRLFWGSSATEPAVVLFSFVFLVALGVDYNIFLVHRVRGEAVTKGTAAGVLAGLTSTGGVISAAGLVLAATFAALGVMPLLYLVQIGLIVSVGVLIDTLLVRLFLVPALMTDLGPRVWWPSRLAGDRAPHAPAALPAPEAGGASSSPAPAMRT